MKKLLFCILLTFFTPLWALTGNIADGEKKTNTCVACHGVDGNSNAPNWPKLSGQYQGYLVKQLMEFRMGEEGPRHDPSMYPMVANLSDQDIHDLASYYSSLKQSSGNTPSQYKDLGERIYRGGNMATGVTACIACHGPKGLGNDLAGYPRVSGQNAQYTKDQLMAFKEGRRKNDNAAMMRMIANKLTAAEMEAVSFYIEGLH